MKKILALALATALSAVQALAAGYSTLLPNGQQQFIDANGAPYAGGQVCFYVPSTLTPKQTWQDSGQSTPNTTPCITLDSAGRALVYGSGTYRQILLDSLGNTIWDKLSDQLASSVDVQNGGPFWGGTDTGSANAYAFALSDPPLAAYHAGQRFQFIPANSSTSASTLSINSIGAVAIKKPTASGLAVLTGGELVAGQVIDVEYDGTFFEIMNQYQSTPPTAIAVGTISLFSLSTPPTGWLSCNGQAVNRVTYANLFALIGTTYGAGDGSTTFNLPDMRGYFPRGWDDGRNVDPGRVFASAQTDAFQGHTFTLTGISGGQQFWLQPVAGGVTWTTNPTAGGAQLTTVGISNAPVTDGTNGTPRIAAETRPVNLALLYIIKY